MTPTPPNHHGGHSDALDTIIVVVDGPVDLTRRPRDPRMPRVELPPAEAERDPIILLVDGPVDLTRRPRDPRMPRGEIPTDRLDQ